MTLSETDPGSRTLHDLADSCRQELTSLQAEMMELDLLIRQTSAEIERLEPRVAEIARKLREVESQADAYSRAEIKEVYAAAQETQVRHFMMQLQLDQLNNKATTLQRYEAHLRQVLGVMPEVESRTHSESPIASSSVVRHDYSDRSASPGIDDSTLGQMVQAQEAERYKIAEEINEGPVQLLANLVLRAEICERLLSTNDERAIEEVRQIKDRITNALRETRRFVYQLRPVVIGELGLLATLRKYSHGLSEKTGIAVTIEGNGFDSRWPEHVELAVFRIVQDAIDQALERPQVSAVEVNLTASSSEIKVELQDDGKPKTVDRRTPAEVQGKQGADSARLRERMQLLGATAVSEAIPGRGHRVSITIPLRQT